MKNKKLMTFLISIISIFILVYIFLPKYYESYVLKNDVAKLPYEFVEEGQVIYVDNGTKKSTQIKTKVMETKEEFDLDLKDFDTNNLGRKFYLATYTPNNYEFETAVNMYYLSQKNFDINEPSLETRNEDLGPVQVFKKVENHKDYSETYMLINTLVDKDILNSLSNPKIFLNNSLTYQEKDIPAVNYILTSEDIANPSYREVESDIFSKAYYVERKNGMKIFLGINPLKENIKYYNFDDVTLEKIIIKEEYEEEYNTSYVMLSATNLSSDEFNKIIESIKAL